MSRLTQKPPQNVEIQGVAYAINGYYVNALLTWDAFEAAHAGEISELAAAVTAIDNMFHEPRPPVCEETLRAIGDYLQAYSGTGGGKDVRPPLLCLEQDSQMIYDGILAAGVDLDAERVSFPRFMSLLREMPKDAQLCRVIYLRQQHRAGKLTKDERAECGRRGWDVIKLRNRRAEKDAADNREYFRELQNKKRAERGLPPI